MTVWFHQKHVLLATVQTVFTKAKIFSLKLKQLWLYTHPFTTTTHAGLET